MSNEQLMALADEMAAENDELINYYSDKLLALATPSPQAATLWIQFSDDRKNIRFWTNDPDRALEESFCHGRPLTAFYATPQPQGDTNSQARPDGGEAVACTVVGYLPSDRAVEVRLRCEIPEWITNRRTDDAWLSSHKPATHPAACELRAVRAAIQKARNIADGASACNAQGLQHQAGMRRACNIIEAALQHRGDSRGGEG